MPRKFVIATILLEVNANDDKEAIDIARQHVVKFHADNVTLRGISNVRNIAGPAVQMYKRDS